MSSTFFISIQGSYNQLNVALFKSHSCLEDIINREARSSSRLIPILIDLLARHNLTYKDLSFIAIDQGPGAFTSLRVALATVNGIAFNQSIPLIGINGLEVLEYQTIIDADQNIPLSVLVLLNAYNNDVYYRLSTSGELLEGYKKIDELIQELQEKFAGKILVTGNGALLHKELLLKSFGSHIQFAQPHYDVCPAKTIGQLALECWIKKENISYSVAPLYLKTQLFAIKK